ncbi:MAG: sigma-70 family RNA polymerase sigma factor [Pseudohongiella sp.]|nr:sigma-70 family RNA polymerase sigma factor [Pseudohongiella sp.]MDP3517768.1 sigma-70 family RNA polymerase sigma factor [Pseudohongiella sp.]
MTAIADGDQRVYADAVRQHSRAIGFYAFRMLGNKDSAEDIAQETFLRLWTHADRWRSDKASISTWLHRIAHNLCIDSMRKDRSSQTEEFEDEIPDQARDAELQQEWDERQQRLQAALMMMPERQRSAIVLTHYQGLGNQAVASIMDLSVDALESLLARSRRALRTMLADLQEPVHNKQVRLHQSNDKKAGQSGPGEQT